jgi:hypothetical protein
MEHACILLAQTILTNHRPSVLSTTVDRDIFAGKIFHLLNFHVV